MRGQWPFVRPLRTQLPGPVALKEERAFGPSSLVARRMPTRRDRHDSIRRLRIRRQESFGSHSSQMIVTRFAPSPTGRLHLGHAFSAALGHAQARESGGEFLLRIEDLDQARSRPEFVDGIDEDLRWLGLAWDEPVAGPVAADAGLCRRRSTDCAAAGLVYACFCTRADIAAVADRAARRCGDIYPGTCRALARRSGAPREQRRTAGGSMRPRRSSSPDLPSWTEADGQQLHGQHSEQIGDAILARKDAPAQLSSRLRRRRCGERGDAGRARRGPARRRPRSSACCRCCSACPSRPICIIRWSPMQTAGGSPSATSRRPLPRCATRASTAANWPRDLLAGIAPVWFSPCATPR